MRTRKLGPLQKRLLTNLKEGRDLDHGVACAPGVAGALGNTLYGLVRHRLIREGWKRYLLTNQGRQALATGRFVPFVLGGADVQKR